MAGAAVGLAKGAQVLIEGALRSREYDRDVSVGSQTATSASACAKSRIDQIIKRSIGHRRRSLSMNRRRSERPPARIIL